MSIFPCPWRRQSACKPAKKSSGNCWIGLNYTWYENSYLSSKPLKGCKTWTAFNLASFLGLAGNSVLAIDLNPQHDLAADHRILMEEGVYPRFKVLSHDIV